MILHDITLRNFGIYGGIHHFELTPQQDGRFHKPLVVVRGQNGVGKSTLMEAIRLALHGKVSLGNRTMQRTYEEYLAQRLHRSPEGETADFASLELHFEHVFLGIRHHYRVQRTWSWRNQRLATNLNLWIDDQLGSESEEEMEHLLRELIAPGVVELFFFDGEKISTLAEAGDASEALLADTVKNLLGLHLVEQLDKDLDIYLLRQSGVKEWSQYQMELAQLNEAIAEATQQQREKGDMLADCRRKLYHKRQEIEAVREKLVQQGGSYAKTEKAQGQKRDKYKQALAQTEQMIEELGRGLLPLMVAPQLLTAVRERLHMERAFEQWQAAQPLVQEIQPLVAALEASEPSQQLQAVVARLAEPPMDESAVIHRVSAEKRGLLLNWIGEALQETPAQLAELLNQRRQHQQALAKVEQALKRVPLAELLQPLQEEMERLNRELGRLEGEAERLTHEEKGYLRQIAMLEIKRRQVGEKMATVNMEEGRLKMAARTKMLLDRYREALIGRKLTELGDLLTKRFTQLSRKANRLIDQIVIDPHTFALSLRRGGKVVPRTQLSAGEAQILAVATLWALREVSGRPLPMVIDTPLSRLDEAHRQAVLEVFLPQAAQQVVVLATTAEVDEDTLRYLRPLISHAYLLQSESTATQVVVQPQADTPRQLFLREIEVNYAV